MAKLRPARRIGYGWQIWVDNEWIQVIGIGKTKSYRSGIKSRVFRDSQGRRFNRLSHEMILCRNLKEASDYPIEKP